MGVATPYARLQVLGTLTLRSGGGAELRSVLTQSKATAALVYLTVASPRGTHRRDTLLGLLWPELPEGRARVALNKVVHQLRRSLGESVVVRRGEAELGVAGRHVRCDAVRFERALARGERERALRLYRGEMLPGFHLTGAPQFMDWLEERRAQLRRLALRAALDLAEEHSRIDPATALGWAQRARTIDRLDERAVRSVIELLDRVGDRSTAVREYERFVDLLAREYEIEPAPETTAVANVARLRVGPAESRP